MKVVEALLIEPALMGGLCSASFDQQFNKIVADLISKNVVPQECLITPNGLNEFLGFRFSPLVAIEKLPQTAATTFLDIQSYLEPQPLFSGTIGKGRIAFNMFEYVGRGVERLVELKFSGPEIMAPLKTAVRGMVRSSTLDFLSHYWTLRAMTSDAFVRKFVPEDKLPAFFADMLRLSWRYSVPCVRLAFYYADRFMTEKVKGRYAWEGAYLDEETVWTLLLGSAAPTGVKRTYFLSAENKLEKACNYFASILCALETMKMLPDPRRLAHLPGTIGIVDTKAPATPIKTISISEIVAKYRN